MVRVAGQRQSGVRDDDTGDAVAAEIHLALAKHAGRAAGHCVLNEVMAVPFFGLDGDKDGCRPVVARIGPRGKQP